MRSSIFAMGIASLMSASFVAHAQAVSGVARAVDGDTLNISGLVIRLYGIDAPELNQGCVRAGAPWSCGREAADQLAAYVAGQQIRCERRDIDDYGRVVATCKVGSLDLSAAMADAGLAVALPHFSAAYVLNEARARDRRIGLWDSDFQLPRDYRTAHPTPQQKSAPPATGARQSLARPKPSGVYYRGCNEARAAGAAPIYRGQPGYRPEMDGDGDGIACEPYRGRR